MGRERRAIVAVFGGNKVEDGVLTLAEDLGRTLAERHIVLTGGRAPSSHRNVKDRALRGASEGPWIGISKSNRISGKPAGNGFLIESGLDDRRNYLNAHLCDAAIVLEGGDGTTSEAIFALALGKPVVLVGKKHWRRQLDLDGDDAWGGWARTVRWVTRQNESSWPELDFLIEARTESNRLRELSPSPHVLRSRSEVREILAALPLPPTLRQLTEEAVFPVSAPRYREVARELIKWIGGL